MPQIANSEQLQKLILKWHSLEKGASLMLFNCRKVIKS